MDLVLNISSLACALFLLYELYTNRKLKKRINELEKALNER